MVCVRVAFILISNIDTLRICKVYLKLGEVYSYAYLK